MRGNKIVCKVTGVILAIAGSVIVIHTVPVYLWLIVLITLILIFGFFMLSDNGWRK